MSRKLAKTKRPQPRVSKEELAAGLKKTLEGKYGRILEAAKRKWEREFGAKKEPSDASVSVRVTDKPAKTRRLGRPRNKK